MAKRPDSDCPSIEQMVEYQQIKTDREEKRLSQLQGLSHFKNRVEKKGEGYGISCDESVDGEILVSIVVPSPCPEMQRFLEMDFLSDYDITTRRDGNMELTASTGIDITHMHMTICEEQK